MTNTKIDFKYILVTIIVVLTTWIIHEFAHWMTAEMLGYESVMKLNGTYSISSKEQTDWHRNVISAAGPIITILQGLVAFFLLKTRHWNKYVYLFLFTAFYMRALAGLMNFINLNDEGRISQFLKIGTFTIPILVSSLLFFLVYKVSKKYKLNLKFQSATILVIMALSSILIMTDQFVGIRIL